MTLIPRRPGLALALLTLTAPAAWSQETAPSGPATQGMEAEPTTVEAASGDPNIAAVSEEGGRYLTADGIPTYNIAADGTVDWPTYSGFRRYHAECHVCHGPDGEGSSYAPALKESALRLDYYDFYGIVAGGRQNVDAGHQNVMPAFGTNVNVMCYLDDIYVYLKARGTEELPRGRPAKREDKSEAIAEAENACLGT